MSLSSSSNNEDYGTVVSECFAFDGDSSKGIKFGKYWYWLCFILFVCVCEREREIIINYFYSHNILSCSYFLLQTLQ